MKKILSLKLLLVLIFVFVSILSALLVFSNNAKPQVILSNNTTYYLPGQYNNCLWILQLDDTISDTVGESTTVRIGIPEAEKRGYIGGRLEVGKNQTLILVFNAPNLSKVSPPVILTADYSGISLPINSIRFRWMQSSQITVPLFQTRIACLAAGATK